MKFTKYEERGAYHWREYVRGMKYRYHVDYIRKWVKEKNILDVGAGDGVITYVLRAKGIECEEAALNIAKAMGIDITYGDAYSLPYPDDSFNAVTMFDVIEHFATPEFALAEARRVAPVLYITTPERGMVRDPFHVKEWKRDELPIFMRENGWQLDGEVTVIKEHKAMYARFTRI